MMRVEGYKATVTFDGEVITIARAGVIARTAAGSAETQIAVADLDGVQLKQAGALSNGSITFGRTPSPQNQVFFLKGQQANFETLRDEISSVLAAHPREGEADDEPEASPKKGIGAWLAGVAASTPINEVFGPYTVSNMAWGKMVEPTVRKGLTAVWPAANVAAEVEVGNEKKRMTATRVIAGGALLGPAGLVLGGLARKDISEGYLVLTIQGVGVQRHKFPGKELEKAMAWVDALNTAKMLA